MYEIDPQPMWCYFQNINEDPFVKLNIKWWRWEWLLWWWWDLKDDGGNAADDGEDDGHDDGDDDCDNDGNADGNDDGSDNDGGDNDGAISDNAGGDNDGDCGDRWWWLYCQGDADHYKYIIIYILIYKYIINFLHFHWTENTQKRN